MNTSKAGCKASRKERKDYAIWRQFNEKPSIIPGCPGARPLLESAFTLAASASQVLMTRHTVMVVGQTGGGKSVILQTLARSQTKMGKRTTMNVLNPKVNP